MTELDTLLEKTFASGGKPEDANKFYLSFLRTKLFIPISKPQSPEIESLKEDEFIPIFTHYQNTFYMMIFDTLQRLKSWSQNADDLYYKQIRGRDIIKGLGEHVFLCLNYGSKYYKEFAPDEIMELKRIITKLDSLFKEQK